MQVSSNFLAARAAMNSIRPKQFGILYGTVVIAGLAILSVAVYRLMQAPEPWFWVLLSLLTLAAGSLSLKITGTNGRVAVGDTLICMSLILFGPLPGAVTAALEGIAGSLRCRNASRRLEFLSFNAGAMAVSAYIAGQVFCAAQGGPLFQNGLTAALDPLPGSLVLLAATYFGANTLLVAAAAATEKSAGVYRTWRDNFLWTYVNYLAAAFLSGMIVQISNPLTWPMLATMIAGCMGIHLSARAHMSSLAKSRANIPLA
jgi:hypothetical protein